MVLEYIDGFLCWGVRPFPERDVLSITTTSSDEASVLELCGVWSAPLSRGIKVGESVLNSRWKVDNDNLILLHNIVMFERVSANLCWYSTRCPFSEYKSAYCLVGKESVYICVCVHVYMFIEPLA